MADAPRLRVRGETVTEVAPEIARFSVTVAARDRDRQATLRRLTERVEAVRALIDGFGAAVDRRETGELWVRPERKRSGERVSAYHGSVGTLVTVTDFTVLGELMLRLADLDQATVAGPWWALRPDSPVHAEARRAAVGAAIDRAREYAAALGAEVTALVELVDAPEERPVLARAMAFAPGGGGEGPPTLDLDPQPQTVQVSVTATFTISAPTVLAASGD